MQLSGFIRKKLTFPKAEWRKIGSQPPERGPMDRIGDHQSCLPPRSYLAAPISSAHFPTRNAKNNAAPTNLAATSGGYCAAKKR
jgi:hypothetical protein